MNMSPFVLFFQDEGCKNISNVGGKGANLALMSSAGLPVPPGFCVTTKAFDAFVASGPEYDAMLLELDSLSSDDIEGVRQKGSRMRELMEGIEVPKDVREALHLAIERLGSRLSVAVRSSATLEDLPTASFAGQQDTYLGIRGEAAVLMAVRRCFASLFTDRAIIYRKRQRYASRSAKLSVVVQLMIESDVSGILFTADPTSGQRHVCAIDASYGLGEALVSGLVNADLFRVDKRRMTILERRIGDKRLQIHSSPEGGIVRVATGEEQSTRPCLTDAQVLALTELGIKLETLQGCAQDVEWCVFNNALHVVQSRAITSLFPVPEPHPTYTAQHIYVSFNHLQVMTEPIRPMGASVLKYMIPAGKNTLDAASGIISMAAGRMYVDITAAMRRFPFRHLLLTVLKVVDVRIYDHVMPVLRRPEFERPAGIRADPRPRAHPPVLLVSAVAGSVGRLLINIFRRDPQKTVDKVIPLLGDTVTAIGDRSRSAGTPLQRVLILRREMSRIFIAFLPHFIPMVFAGIVHWAILSFQVRRFADATQVQKLVKGLEGNITTEMDLELADLADIARRYPTLVTELRSGDPRGAIHHARERREATAFVEVWDAFIEKYGHRCPGEIDISSTRWREDPSSLLQSVVGLLHSPDSGAHRVQQRRLREEADRLAKDLASKTSRGLLGPLRAWLVRHSYHKIRTYLPLREHGKYFLIRAMAIYREALLDAADELVKRGWLLSRADVWYLDLDELVKVLEMGGPNVAGPSAEQFRHIVEQRRSDHEHFRSIKAPRVILSDGEIPKPTDSCAALAPGSYAGLAASGGIAEGVAKVILDPSTDVLNHGEVLIAPFTDPGWTPLFIHASALVMEVGGLMTHGSVIAREYGIPAVVSVDNATQLIKTGQRVRVDGDLGVVTVLPDISLT